MLGIKLKHYQEDLQEGLFLIQYSIRITGIISARLEIFGHETNCLIKNRYEWGDRQKVLLLVLYEGLTY